MLVFIVGSFGLLSNIIGLFLFHEHSHSHSHGHEHDGEYGTLPSAEEGQVHEISSAAIDHPRPSPRQGGNLNKDISPSEDSTGQKSDTLNKNDEDSSTVACSNSPISRRKRRHTSLSVARYSTSEDIDVYPPRLRENIIAKGRLEDTSSTTDDDSEREEAITDDQEPKEDTSLLGKQRRRSDTAKNRSNVRFPGSKPEPHKQGASLHKSHKHSQPKKSAKDSGNLNIRGVFLHVIGDALGNVGVMVSAVIIRFWTSPLSLYADPAISLVITCIILASAIPLCKAASRILLQAVPAGMDVDDIKEDIKELPGVLNCHHLHVWQLSDTKLIASLHIEVEYDFKGEGSVRYMELARAVQDCLHGYGIHSSTIQPEFCLDPERFHSRQDSDAEGEGTHQASSGAGGLKGASAKGSKAGSMRAEPDACLLQCGTECDERGQCCAPGVEDFEARDEHS